MSGNGEDFNLDAEPEDKGPPSGEGVRQEDMPESAAFIEDHRLEEGQAQRTGRTGNLAVCWFPESISQFQLGSLNKRSNACTIIALLVAEKIHTQGIQILITRPVNNNSPPVSKLIVNAFADCIFKGNQIHNKLWREKKLKDPNLSVPDAIEAAGDKMDYIMEWCSLGSERDIKKYLYEDLKEKTDEWTKETPQQCGSDLYVVLIADNRSVLFVFQKEIDKVTLIDSHQHYMLEGAVMAQVPPKSLSLLCDWYTRLLSYYSKITEYELTYLYFWRSEASREMP